MNLSTGQIEVLSHQDLIPYADYFNEVKQRPWSVSAVMTAEQIIETSLPSTPLADSVSEGSGIYQEIQPREMERLVEEENPLLTTEIESTSQSLFEEDDLTDLEIPVILETTGQALLIFA